MPLERNKDWEYHLSMDIMPDAYGEDERMMSWFYYLEEKLHFPFQARCVKVRRKSPLKMGEIVEVVGQPEGDEWDKEMPVTVRWQGRELDVPLDQLEGIDVDEDTQEGISDWHYWVEQGYEF
jgi:hypothetical protein